VVHHPAPASAPEQRRERKVAVAVERVANVVVGLSGRCPVAENGGAERPPRQHAAWQRRGSDLAGARARILVKARDADARPGSGIVAERPRSVRSGRTWQELAND
jgi:hypothetical protein